MAEQTIDIYVNPPGLLGREAQPTGRVATPVQAGFISDTKQLSQVPGGSGRAEVGVSQGEGQACESSESGLSSRRICQRLQLLLTPVLGRVNPG